MTDTALRTAHDEEENLTRVDTMGDSTDSPTASSTELHRGSVKGGPCPDCGHEVSRVYRSEGPRRYRACANPGCTARWWTEEAYRGRVARRGKAA